MKIIIYKRINKVNKIIGKKWIIVTEYINADQWIMQMDNINRPKWIRFVDKIMSDNWISTKNLNYDIKMSYKILTKLEEQNELNWAIK